MYTATYNFSDSPAYFGGIWKSWFFKKGEKRGYPEKIPRVETSVPGEYPQGENRSNRRKAAWSQEENEQKSQPTSDVTSGPH